jgi:hypothetical protein
MVFCGAVAGVEIAIVAELIGRLGVADFFRNFGIARIMLDLIGW